MIDALSSKAQGLAGELESILGGAGDIVNQLAKLGIDATQFLPDLDVLGDTRIVAELILNMDVAITFGNLFRERAGCL